MHFNNRFIPVSTGLTFGSRKTKKLKMIVWDGPILILLVNDKQKTNVFSGNDVLFSPQI